MRNLSLVQRLGIGNRKAAKLRATFSSGQMEEIVPDVGKNTPCSRVPGIVQKTEQFRV